MEGPRKPPKTSCPGVYANNFQCDEPSRNAHLICLFLIFFKSKAMRRYALQWNPNPSWDYMATSLHLPDLEASKLGSSVPNQLNENPNKLTLLLQSEI
jgi:hypothetical protein